MAIKYITLTNCVLSSYCTLRHRFLPLRFKWSVRFAHGSESNEKTRIRNLQCNREEVVGKTLIFFAAVCLTSSGTISVQAERFQISDAHGKQKEVI